MNALEKDLGIPARTERGPTTTIQLPMSMKATLNELRDGLMDGEGSYADVVGFLIGKVTAAGRDVDQELGTELTARLDRVEAIVNMLVTDPQSGYTFRADHLTTDRGRDGQAGQKWTRFLDSGVYRGLYLISPSGENLNERDKNLPAPVAAMVEKQVRKKEKAREALSQ
jgi:hypothetical protein